MEDTMKKPIFANRTVKHNEKSQSMCNVDKKTITHVNNQMIKRVKVRNILAQNVKDNQIEVRVPVLGSRPYRMSIDRVNEIYGKARQKVVGMSVPHVK